MKFIEFTVSTTTEASELVSDILWDHTNYGIAICDSNDIIDLIENKSSMYWDYIDENLKRRNCEVFVKAYVPENEAEKAAVEIRKKLEMLSQNASGNLPVGSLEVIKREVESDDWIEIWRKHYKPMQLGKVWVCPEWIEHIPGEGEVQIKLDSNMAFGTGEHETTSMCIKLMQNYVKSTDTVIDIGCGSGILGIAALKLGAKKAYLTDIDIVAVNSADHNCRLNGVADRAVITQANLLDNNTVKGDMVFANITADALLALAENISNNINKGGILILSGIIHSRLDEVVARYSSLGFAMIEKKVDGEWNALVMEFYK